MERAAIDKLLSRLGSSGGVKPANERVKAIVDRIVGDLFYTIEEFDVQPAEFWRAIDYLGAVGRSGEWGLVAAGLGFEVFLDERLDAEEAAAGLTGATPRTIEGPLYVAGAPVGLMDGDNPPRLDQDADSGEVLFMSGRVTDVDGQPVVGAMVEVWHANTKGMYSFFDTTQSPFNLRGTLITDAQGRYQFRSVVPVGYAVPPNGQTEHLLDQLGRHGNRPAHIHFFVTADGYRKLTTQINIDGDPFLHDDFAFATRDELIPPILHVTDPEQISAHGLNEPFAMITFDFALNADVAKLPSADVERSRVAA